MKIHIMIIAINFLSIDQKIVPEFIKSAIDFADSGQRLTNMGINNASKAVRIAIPTNEDP